MSIKFSTIPQKRLLAGITSASSTFYLNNILSFDGENNVLSTDLGSQHYCAFRNDTGTVLELMEIDPATISAGPVTILRRGLSFYGDRTTETTALKLDWGANTIVMLGTDVPQIFQYLKEYIDAAAIAGAVPASTTAAGIVVEASQAEYDARTITKTISAVAYKLFAPLNRIRGILYNDYAADSVGTDTYAITITPAITAYVAGQVFTFKAGTANTGAATLNVSGLGDKTIKKRVSVDLDTGDILANQLVIVQYDGTNMQLLSASFVLASTTTNGIVEESTDAEADAGTSSGGTGARLFLNPSNKRNKVLVNTTEITHAAASEVTLFTGTVPGGIIGTANALRITAYFSALNFGLGDVLTLRLKYGATTIATQTSPAANAVTNVTMLSITGYVVGDGATNAQKGAIMSNGGDSYAEARNATNTESSKWLGGGSGSAVIDSTANQTLSLTAEWNDTSCTLTAEFWIVESIR